MKIKLFTLILSVMFMIGSIISCGDYTAKLTSQVRGNIAAYFQDEDIYAEIVDITLINVSKNKYEGIITLRPDIDRSIKAISLLYEIDEEYIREIVISAREDEEVEYTDHDISVVSDKRSFKWEITDDISDYRLDDDDFDDIDYFW